jgi:integrase
MGRLNALQVKTVKKPGRYHDGDGLMLVVKESGARSWLLRIQFNGRRRDFGLGSANHVSLAEARESALETRKLVRAGVDPVVAKKASRAAAAAIPTFHEAATNAHAAQKGGWKNAKHRSQWLASLEAYAHPHIGNIPVDQVDGPMIIRLLTPIWLTKPETARRVRQRVVAVLDWAHACGFRATEAPSRSIGKGLARQPKKTGRFAALHYREVPLLVGALGKVRTVGRLALNFLILTGARSGEVRGAVWEEIDLHQKTWTVPASRMKAGREHVVPLSPAALEILRAIDTIRTGRAREPVFPGQTGKPLSDMTLSKVLKSLTSTKSTVHGFRSSFRDWVAECTDWPGEVAEQALAHTIANRSEAAYRRTNFLDKRRALMGEWANYVTSSIPST